MRVSLACGSQSRRSPSRGTRGDASLADLYTPDQAAAARDWITPFRQSFPDVQMDTIELITEGDTVIGHFTGSATHTGT